MLRTSFEVQTQMHEGRGFAVLALPFEEYARVPAVNRGSLMQMMKSPAHFRSHELAPRVVAPNPAMQHGSLVHVLALEPHLFADIYRVGPDVASKALKEWKDAVKVEPDKEWITPAQHELALAQAHVIVRVPELDELLMRSTTWIEVSCFWRDDVTGLWLKCRADVMALVGIEGEDSYGWVVVDLKTTGSAAPDKFARSVIEYGYAEQCVLYSAGVAEATGIPVHKFIIAASETDAPHVCELYELKARWQLSAAQRCRDAIDRIAQCRRTGEWPSYFPDGGVHELDAPAWYARQNDFEPA